MDDYKTATSEDKGMTFWNPNPNGAADSHANFVGSGTLNVSEKVILAIAPSTDWNNDCILQRTEAKKVNGETLKRMTQTLKSAAGDDDEAVVRRRASTKITVKNNTAFRATMLMNTIFVVCSLAGISFASEDIIGEATHLGMSFLQQARVSGATIRQCSCREMDICIKQFKQHATICTDTCWQHIGKLASHPAQLRSCFKKQQPLLESFVACIGANARACVNSENGPQIPKQDIRQLIHIGEQGFETSKKTFMSNSALQPYMRIVSAGIDFGNCFKDCYVKMHEEGFCFDKQGELQNFCPLLKAMTRKIHV
uniref:Chondroitin proteoglycan 4 domain-containing protein n=1 Tax=Ascaris lumbricoides TaxID=6252 RepID=A0A0M3HQA4_ASCLU